MAKLILICGKICSGKTTYAKTLVKKNNAVLLSVDEITLALFGQNIGENHDEIVEKTENYLFAKAEEIIATGTDVIFDFGFWTRAEREKVKSIFRIKGIKTEWHYVDVSGEMWRANLAQRNSEVAAGGNFAYYVDCNVARKFSAVFEEPEHREIDVWFRNERI